MVRPLNVAPTKSNHLALSRQLDFARNGYDLLVPQLTPSVQVAKKTPS